MTITDLISVLKTKFGYNEFREPQDKIILSILDGNDTLAILPTSAGKSLCYQLPSLLLEGLTIVISPLISLMQDQVEQIKNKVPANYLNSFQSFQEQQKVLALILNNQIKLLYVSPEKFITEGFKNLIHKTKVSLIVVDEAHCISQWGHDFRPSYLRITEIFSIIPRCTIAAFTATATPEVREDIIKKLKLKEPKIFVKGFYRENISLEVIKARKKFDRLLDILSNVDGSKIIYCPTRRDTENLHQKLTEKNFSSLPYHAGLTKDERTTTQDFFINEQVEILVATNAFGMGINKPNIRAVIHYGMPGSIESFYQEIGRAGRDGKKSYSYLFFSSSDRKIHEFFINNTFPSKKFIQNFYDELNNFIKLKIGEQSTKVFPIDNKQLNLITGLNLNDATIKSILRIFEENRVIRRVSENDYIFIKLKISPKEIDNYKEVLNTAEFAIIEYLVRKFGSKIFSQSVKISIASIINQLEIYRSKLEIILDELEQNGFIEYSIVSIGNGFYFCIPRVYSENLPIDFSEIENHRAKQINRLNQIENYSNTNECRWRFILQHFGEDIDDNFRCGICDNCFTSKKYFTLTPNAIEKEILKTIKEVNGKFGISTIVDILKGSKSKKILENNLFNVSTYGALSGLNSQNIKEVITNLIAQDKIHQSSSIYSVLSLTSKGEEIVKNHSVQLSIPSIRKLATNHIDLRKNLDLFQRLKNVRKSLAQKYSQPEFLICSDEVLRELAIKIPTTEEEFLKVKGVTPKLFLKCGSEIIETIKDFISEKNDLF